MPRSDSDRDTADLLLAVVRHRAAAALPVLLVEAPTDGAAPVPAAMRRALAEFVAHLAPAYQLAFAELAGLPTVGLRLDLAHAATHVAPALDGVLDARDYVDYDELADPMVDAGTCYRAAVAARAYFFGCAAVGRDPFDDQPGAYRRRPALLRLAMGVARTLDS